MATCSVDSSIVAKIWAPRHSLNAVFNTEIESKIFNFWNEKFCTDVDFAVRSNGEWSIFSAHKLVLSIWSPVFADLLSDPNLKMPIKIHDVDQKAFKSMLRYMYGHLPNQSSDSIKSADDVKEIVDLFKVSVKYQIISLKNSCQEMLTFCVPNVDNVFALLTAAKTLKIKNLKLRCIKVLQSEAVQILSCKPLGEYTPKMVLTILDLQEVSFSSEYEILSWIAGWAQQRTDMDLLKETILPRINLLSLSPVEFGLFARTDFFKSIFDESDGFKIFMNIVCPYSVPLPSLLNANTSQIRTYGTKTMCSLPSQ